MVILKEMGINWSVVSILHLLCSVNGGGLFGGGGVVSGVGWRRRRFAGDVQGLGQAQHFLL